MSKTIRAKFNVAEITQFGNDGRTNVVLFPVLADNEENKTFWKYTPVGKIEIQNINPDVNFELGTYYVDFIKADD